MTIGKQIRAARKAAGVTHVELGKLLGVSQSVISKYESGDIDMPVSRLLDISEALGVTPAALLGETEPKPDGTAERLQRIAEQLEALAEQLRTLKEGK